MVFTTTSVRLVPDKGREQANRNRGEKQKGFFAHRSRQFPNDRSEILIACQRHRRRRPVALKWA